MRQILTILAVCVFAAGLGFADEKDKPKPEKKVDAKQIKTLIGQLGAADYKTRKAATTELEKIGAPALAELRKVASSSKDPEVRWRAETLISKITAAQKGKVDPKKKGGGKEVVPPFPMPGPGGDVPKELRKLIERLQKQFRGMPMPGPGGPRPMFPGGRRFKFDANGEQRLVVQEDGKTYEFHRKKDGSFKVTIGKGKDKKEHSHKNEDAFKKAQPKVHAIWKRGAGIGVLVPGMGGKDFEKRMKKSIEEMQKRINEMLKRGGLQPPKGERPRVVPPRTTPPKTERPKVETPKVEKKGPLRQGLRLKVPSAALLAQLGLKSAVLVDASKGGAGAKLGLAQHDLITTVNGKPATSTEQIHAAIAAKGTVTLEVLRRGEARTLKAEIK